jgi:hypothetical protein
MVIHKIDEESNAVQRFLCDLPKETHASLIKHIVMRWTSDIYRSHMTNFAVDSADYPCWL